LTGKNVGQGEKIDAILLDTNEYYVRIGNFAYLKINLDGLNYRYINDSWVECYETITPNRIVAIAQPPKTNDELLQLYNHNKEGFKTAFDYKPLDGIR
jgi:hypothetical protein